MQHERETVTTYYRKALGIVWSDSKGMADSGKPPVNDAFKLTLTEEEQLLQFGTQHS